MKIEYVDSGIANNFGDRIEMHKGLKEYPHLHDAILKHELEHSNVSGFTRYDFMHDIGTANYSIKEMFKFIVANPKSLLQFSPFIKRGDTLYYDINLIIVWSFIFSLIGLGLFLGFVL